MIQKNRHTTSRTRRFLLGMATAVGIMSALWCGSFVSLADATATVKVGSAKIREKADANSTVIGSTSQGKTVTLKSEVADASGVAWYEVYIGSGTTGYIRADLVEKNNDGDVPKVEAGSTDNQSDAGAAVSSGASGATVQAENAMDAQYATVSVNCKVRATPSTNDTVVENLTSGTQVVVSGQSNGSSDNKTWYYVTFTGANGGEKTGFIRSDLLALGDMVPMPEETAPMEPETPIEPEVTPYYNSDYELVYREAEGAWYLIDHTVGEEYTDEYKLSQLLEAAQNQSDETSEDAKTLVKQRIAIVALVVLAVVLIIAVIIMAVKLRDAYYEDYEDDEEDEEDEDEEGDEEEEEEEAPSRRRRRVEEEEETSSRRRRRAEEEEEPQPRRRRRAEEEEEAAKPAASTAAKRKAKNFLLDDEEFEFEFLNMDDKK